ncbi:MAG TPA: hypothetical protein VI914_05365 [Thermodesulfobacteriota bacterium]|nr:hypothetical protein [Thermodesulfobacteriota bacterium]
MISAKGDKKMNAFFAIIFFLAFLSGPVPCFAGEGPKKDEESVRDMIIRLDKEYRFLNEGMGNLESKVKNFPNTSVDISVVKKDMDERLVYLEIRDNDRFLASHIYTQIENDAMRVGGRHQLYNAEIGEGIHNLKAIYYWTAGNDTPKKGAAEIIVSAKLSRRYFVEFLLQKDGGVELMPREFDFVNMAK